MAEYQHLLSAIDDGLSKWRKKREVLRGLDMFVLDNSLREGTLGQLSGNTLRNRWRIFEEVKKCGFENIIVSCFSHVRRVDEAFAKMLLERESSDMSKYFAFSEIAEGPSMQEFPLGLKKMNEYKIQNPIFEVNVGTYESDPVKFQTLCDLLRERFDYTYENLSPHAKIFVNIRDFAPAMTKLPTDVFNLVKFLGTMPDGKRPFGILFEDPTGCYLPEQLATWTRSVRHLMDDCHWDSAHLLVHIHKKWGFSEVTQLECLANGADGVWASVCEEGVALGHACSAISVMNLVRLGNTRVLEKYNCGYLRQAAINVTRIVTGSPPHSKQVLYGESMFGTEGEEEVGENDIHLSKFFGVEAQINVFTPATPDLMKKRLVQEFGENKHFTEDAVMKMKAVIADDDANGRKEVYMSDVGLAILFQRANGMLTAEMSATIEETMSEPLNC